MGINIWINIIIYAVLLPKISSTSVLIIVILLIIIQITNHG